MTAAPDDASGGVNLERVGLVLARHLTGLGLALLLRDEATGEAHEVQPDTAGAPDGALPAFLAAADAVWREATGRGLGLRLEPDAGSLLGQRVAGIAAAPFSVACLCLLEATERARGADAVDVTALAAVAEAALANAGTMGESSLSRAKQASPCPEADGGHA